MMGCGKSRKASRLPQGMKDVALSLPSPPLPILARTPRTHQWANDECGLARDKRRDLQGGGGETPWFEGSCTQQQ